MHIISQFADRSATIGVMGNIPELAKLTHEFCRVFNVRASAASEVGGWPIEVLTPEGFSIGYLRTIKEWDARSCENVLQYQFYSDNFVNKERRGGHGRNVRSSAKISSLVAASKKSDATPTTENLFKRVFKRGIGYAFSNVEGRRSTPTISIDDATTLKLVEAHLGVDKFSVATITDTLRAKYEEYLEEKRKLGDSKADSARFNRGATVIGITTSAPIYYVVGDIHKEGSELKVQGSLKRYSSLTELPDLMGTVAIIREFMKGQSSYESSNELGVCCVDKFYFDLDISVGHYGSDLIWVAIPKEGK